MPSVKKNAHAYNRLLELMDSRTREWVIERAGETAMRPRQTDNREPLHVQARLRLFRSLFSALTLNSVRGSFVLVSRRHPRARADT